MDGSNADALRGTLRSVPETKDVELDVVGRVPSYLTGTLLRNGPGAFELKHRDGNTSTLQHWFDGVSMLHRFAVNGETGSIRYMSRFTAVGLIDAAKSVDKKNFKTNENFGLQAPCKSMFGRLMSMFRPNTEDPEGKETKNIGVSVENIPGLGLTSRTDSPFSFHLGAEDIEIGEFFHWSALKLRKGGQNEKHLSGDMSAAHGELDEETKEYFNFVYELGLGGNVDYKVFRVGPGGEGEVLATIPAPATYCHSLSLTKKYVILIIYPLLVNTPRLLYTNSLDGGLRFDESRDTQFFVISRENGGVVAEYKANPCWVFHTCNAFDIPEEDGVSIDLCRYEDASVLSGLYLSNMRSGGDVPSPKLCRYTLKGVTSPKTGRRVEAVQLNSPSIELVRVNPLARLRKYKYVYGPSDNLNDKGVFASVAKLNVSDGSHVKWMDGNLHCSEAIFFPDPCGVEEDDGCLLSVCYDATSDRSFLVVLDARTMTEVARAHTSSCSGRLPWCICVDAWWH